MTVKTPSKNRDPSKRNRAVEEKQVLSTRDIGVSLTVSKEALAEIDKLEQRNVEAARKTLKMSWR